MKGFLRGLSWAGVGLALGACGVEAERQLPPEAGESVGALVTAAPLGTSTADEVYAEALAQLQADFDAAWAKDPSVVQVPVAGLYAFSGGWNLYDALKKFATDFGAAEVLLADFAAEAPAWLEAKVRSAADAQGVVRDDVRDPSLPAYFWRALAVTRERNAYQRVKDPVGVSMQSLRQAWEQAAAAVPSPRGASLALPMTLSHLPSASEMAELLGLDACEMPLESQGFQAVADFGAALGPSAQSAYVPVAQALRKPSFRRRYYFAGGSDSRCQQYYGYWTDQRLAVVDEHHQLLVFQVAYGE